MTFMSDDELADMMRAIDGNVDSEAWCIVLPIGGSAGALQHMVVQQVL